MCGTDIDNELVNNFQPRVYLKLFVWCIAVPPPPLSQTIIYLVRALTRNMERISEGAENAEYTFRKIR